MPAPPQLNTSPLPRGTAFSPGKMPPHLPPNISPMQPTRANFFLDAKQKANVAHFLFACESAASPVSLSSLFLSLPARASITT
jgi:hypothetical protein